MRIALGGAAAALALCAAVGTAGCSSASSSVAEPTFDGAVPDFTGGWAAEFQDAYKRAHTDKERRILVDGVITAQEYADAHAATNACMRDNGYYIEWIDGGGFSVGSLKEDYSDDFQSKMNPVLEKCEDANDGSVTALYEWTTKNPENIDDRSAIVKCFLDNELVPKGYTVRDYDRQNEDYSFPFGESDQTADRCMSDPWGLWGKRK